VVHRARLAASSIISALGGTLEDGQVSVAARIRPKHLTASTITDGKIAGTDAIADPGRVRQITAAVLTASGSGRACGIDDG
jgi:hypothetical protein